MPKPSVKPNNPHFYFRPLRETARLVGRRAERRHSRRSHRAKGSKAKLGAVIERSKSLLGIPEEYRLADVPASDTGAIEMALWTLVGERGLDIFVWENFGAEWAHDCKNQLKLKDLRILKANYGQLPDLSQADWSRDVLFTWNGTTSGVCVPNGDWIAADRTGLSICDATSLSSPCPCLGTSSMW